MKTTRAFALAVGVLTQSARILAQDANLVAAKVGPSEAASEAAFAGRLWPPGLVAPAVASDASGNIFVFGGQRIGTSQLQESAELWRFDVGISNWTFLWSSDAGLVMNSMSYSALNSPNPRQAGCLAFSGNELFLLGGVQGNQSSPGQILNAVYWKYSLTLNQWAMLPSAPNATTFVGTFNTTFSPTNWPSARTGASCTADKTGSIWLRM